jgi:two-component system, chemotaxis family, protein-glutamate methylesterase/glutaminase
VRALSQVFFARVSSEENDIAKGALPVRAIVVDDSAYNRVTLSRLLESERDIRVVATAVNGEDAIKQVLRHRPDVVTLDLEMPVMDGFAFLRWLMANVPTPVIAVSSRSSDRSVFKALELGAVDFIAKPGGRVSPRLEEIEGELLAKVRAATEARLENLTRRIRDEELKGPAGAREALPMAQHVELVVIGSSTGGPPALQALFQSMPLLPVAFVVAQHMPPTFTRLFAERVNRLTHFHVKEAEDGERVLAGAVYIAPGGAQTEVVREGESLRVRVTPRRSSDLYAPSVTRLFDSAAAACGDRLLGVILTGMGDDGAAAIPRLRSRGARTIAESPSTAIVFGMPAEAIRTGSVDEVLPIHEMAAAIGRICLQSR